jgi:hypothetical protein
MCAPIASLSALIEPLKPVPGHALETVRWVADFGFPDRVYEADLLAPTQPGMYAIEGGPGPPAIRASIAESLVLRYLNLPVTRVIPLRDLRLCDARASRGVLLLPRRIPVGRGETATSLWQDGRRSPRNRNPREAEAGSFSVP